MAQIVTLVLIQLATLENHIEVLNHLDKRIVVNSMLIEIIVFHDFRPEDARASRHGDVVACHLVD